MQKFLMGFGAGQILVVSYYWFQGPPLVKLIGVWGVMLIFMGPIGYLHYINMRNTCDNCPELRNSPDCIYFNDEKYDEKEDKIEQKIKM